MKIVIQSILFIAIVAIFAVASDRLNKVDNLQSMSEKQSNVVMGDREFLSDVIAHHEGAVTMARVALEKSDRPEIKNFAHEVIIGETKNIADAYVWRRDWFGDTNYIDPAKVDSKITMIQDLGNKDAKFDKRFLDAMIKHHEGAIKMLNAVLVPTTKVEIHTMAIGAVVALAKDIELMKQWEADWYGK